MIHLMVFDDDARRSAGMAGALESLGFRVTQAGPASGAATVLKRERAGVLIIADEVFSGNAGEGLRVAATTAGIPVLVVVNEVGDPRALADRLAGADDWVSRGVLDSELPARVARLMKRRSIAGSASAKAGASFPVDAEFFALVVHDLRTPLNVIGLSLRMIAQAMPKGDPELDEDMRFVEENFHQIERMLAQLSDYYRLFETANPLGPTPFSPRRLVDELIEARAGKASLRFSPLLLDVRSSCPEVVELDPARARLAIQYALVNTNAAANGEPIRLILDGAADRWIIELAVANPAPPSVQSVLLSSGAFERLCGMAAERRGMDLAIAAKVSEMFGGSARLDVADDRSTRVVLDWPARMATN